MAIQEWSKGMVFAFLFSFAAATIFLGFPAQGLGAEELKIGAAYSTGGPGGKLGGELLDGARLAVKYYNDEKGGLAIGGKKHKISLVEYNSNTNPQEGVSVVKRLIEQDKVPIIIGDCISAVVIAQQPVIEKARWPWIMAASAEILTTEGFKYTNRCNMTDSLTAGDYWKGVLTSQPQGKRKLAIFAVATEYGKSKVAQAKKFAPQWGAEIVYDDGFAFKTTDFYPVLTKLKTIKPDMVYMPNYGELAILLKQAKEVGFSATWVSDDTVAPDVLAQMTGDPVVGVNMFTANHPFLDTEDANIYRKYISAGKGPLSIYAGSYALGWDSALRAFKALEKAETISDSEKINTSIREITWKGISTEGKFDATGQVGVTGKVLQVVRNDGTCKLLAEKGALVK
jgi:branched-chain amino acid transport system substrate-binding protein